MLEEVFAKAERSVLATFEIFGFEFQLSNPAMVTTILCVVLILASFIVVRRFKSAGVPSKFQCLVEWLVDIVNNLCKNSAGEHGLAFVPYIGTALVFLALANIVAIFDFLPFVHLYPPTRDINVAGAFAVCSIVIVIYAGFRYKGVKGWARSLCDPIPLVLPFKLLEYASKPASLCLRLFGNIFAGWLLMEMLYAFLPIVAAPFSVYFDLFDGVLQAFIFSYLTIVYIGEAVE